MKRTNYFKLLFIVVFVLSASIVHAGKANGIIKVLVDGDKDYFEDENVKISFKLISRDLYMQVDNKLNERIFIEWENARTNHDRVIFGTDNRLNYRNKKEDESVSSKSWSISHCFYCENPLAALGGNWAMPVYTHGILKLEEENFCMVDFVLPIRFPDGKTKDYKLYVKVQYVNLADASQVIVGTKSKEVKKMMGSPDVIKKDKATKTEEWLYTNNVRIMIENGKVANIVDLKDKK
jgi:hypothetical protein